MVSEEILCSGCGITLRPFMRLCPRCGTVRDEATPIKIPASVQAEEAGAIAIPASTSGNFFKLVSEAPEPEIDSQPDSQLNGQPNGQDDAEQKTEVIPFDVVRLQKTRTPDELFAPPQDLVFLSPNEDKRRFPLFTAAQKTMVVIGAGLLLLMLVIAYLLWRQQQRDLSKNSNAGITITQPQPSVAPTLPLTPAPSPVDDAALGESIKTALMAYNPLGFSRYKFEVKEGVVTIDGEAEHQPEKDGVDNVVRLIAGVKSVVNNLKVKPESLMPWPPLDSPPVKLNSAEAKILDEAMQRQLRLAEQATGRSAAPESEAQREARERAAAKQREEEAASRKAAEERLRREAEEFEKRQEELRRAEAERRGRAEQARLDANALRSGTIAWSGLVDGVDEIVIGGSSVSVRHVDGAPPRDVKTSLSAPVPRAPVSVKLISINGRGPISITQTPSAANGYTTIVRIDDSGKGGDKLYQFTLRWSLDQNRDQ
jgi:hypothetical protein